MKRFSDFAQDETLDGDKTRIEDVLNTEITVLNYRIKNSKYTEKNHSGKCLTLQIEVDGNWFVIFTGSDVLIEQASKYGEEMPFLATIKKIDKYYTFT